MDNNFNIGVIYVNGGTCFMQDISRMTDDKECTVELISNRTSLPYPDLFSAVNTSLAALLADGVSHTSTSDEIYSAYRQLKSQSGDYNNDIIPFKLIGKQKKEVYDIDMTLKHCKTFQCKTRLLSANNFFNN